MGTLLEVVPWDSGVVADAKSIVVGDNFGTDAPYNLACFCTSGICHCASTSQLSTYILNMGESDKYRSADQQYRSTHMPYRHLSG